MSRNLLAAKAPDVARAFSVPCRHSWRHLFFKTAPLKPIFVAA